MENQKSENVITLHSICGGALHELFQNELKRTIENITDPNTDKTKKRTIMMEVVIAPNPKDPRHAYYSVSCKSKLSPVNGVSSQLFMGKQDGEWVAVDHDPRQMDMFDKEGDKANIREVNFTHKEASSS